MLIKILLVLAILVVAFALFVAFRPATYHVERSLAIAAPPAELFAQVNDLRKTQVWSPWVKLDPAGYYGFEGPPAGVGAVNTWSGNHQIGAGRQTIVESRPHELVRLKLEFRKPMASVGVAEFRLRPEGARTVVTWSMDGTCNFIGKAVGLFMDMDKMIGGQFERGLADLAATVAAAPARR